MIVSVAVVLAIAVLPFLGFRAYARRVEAMDASLEDRLHRLRRAQQFGYIVVSVVAILAVVAVDVIGQVQGLLETAVPGLYTLPGVGWLVDLLLIFGVVALPIVSAVLGAYPTERSLRETSASSRAVVKGVLGGMAAMIVSIVFVVEGIGLITSIAGSSTPVLIAALAVVIFAVFALAPYLTLLFSERVSLAGDRRERVEGLCADLGYTPRALYLLEGESTKAANALVAGTLPGLRYVFLTDYLLEECSDAELRAILAHEFGHVAGRHLWQRAILTVAVFGAGIAAYGPLGVAALEAQFGFVGFFLPFIALFLLYYVVFLGGLALWQERRADAYAARTAGVGATVAGLETLADANDTREDVGTVYSLLTHHPPIGDRIDAVRDGVDGRESTRSARTTR
ncbi:M48 family metalloprotease [Halobacteria archaeon AArc-m2/3/4]|uniref:M48 family metalloprotease n=1 Tax=Natronoglomus mannanivorans TaxID=2979990 RepID=A0ABT2QAJ4_9EURY|nr:M48 family metalloprotease [Halobacteria archaeon AArc-m2/3/4]